MKKVLKFVIERETKGAVRYMEVDNTNKEVDLVNQTVGTIYLRKSALGGVMPTRLQVEITDDV